MEPRRQSHDSNGAPSASSGRTPLAYFITWTCYGTWLHGDERGSVDVYNNEFGSTGVPNDVRREARAIGRMRRQPVTLTHDARRIVEGAIQDHCAIRGWNLLAVNVRTNHAHLVVGRAEVEPEAVMKQCKEWGTKRLRNAGVFAPGARVWTDHGSTRYLWDGASVRRAVDYVLNQQDRDGEPLR